MLSPFKIHVRTSIPENYVLSSNCQVRHALEVECLQPFIAPPKYMINIRSDSISVKVNENWCHSHCCLPPRSSQSYFSILCLVGCCQLSRQLVCLTFHSLRGHVEYCVACRFIYVVWDDRNVVWENQSLDNAMLAFSTGIDTFVQRQANPIVILLPIVLTCFISPTKLSSEQFMVRW